MNVRFYNAKILCLKDDAKREYQIIEGELWVRGDAIAYIGDGSDTGGVLQPGEVILWDREIDASGKMLISGFKNAQ